MRKDVFMEMQKVIRKEKRRFQILFLLVSVVSLSAPLFISATSSAFYKEMQLPLPFVASLVYSSNDFLCKYGAMSFLFSLCLAAVFSWKMFSYGKKYRDKFFSVIPPFSKVVQAISMVQMAEIIREGNRKGKEEKYILSSLLDSIENLEYQKILKKCDTNGNLVEEIEKNDPFELFPKLMLAHIVAGEKSHNMSFWMNEAIHFYEMQFYESLASSKKILVWIFGIGGIVIIASVLYGVYLPIFLIK